MANEREDFLLSIGWDLEDLPAGADAIAEAFAELNSLVNGMAIGDPARFGEQGRLLGRALLQGFAAELRGAGDLGSILTQQLNLNPAQFERQGAQIVGVIERIRSLALSAGLPVLEAPRVDSSSLLGLKAVEDQGNRAARAITDVNAQLAIMAARLREGRGYQLSAGQLANPTVARAVQATERRAIEYIPSRQAPYPASTPGVSYVGGGYYAPAVGYPQSTGPIPLGSRAALDSGYSPSASRDVARQMRDYYRAYLQAELEAAQAAIHGAGTGVTAAGRRAGVDLDQYFLEQNRRTSMMWLTEPAVSIRPSAVA